MRRGYGPCTQKNNNKRLLEYFNEFVCSLLDKKAVSTTKVAAAAIIITQNMIDIVEKKEVWGDPRKNPRYTTIGGNPIAIFF